MRDCYCHIKDPPDDMRIRLRDKIIGMLNGGEPAWNALAEHQREVLIQHEILHERALNALASVGIAIRSRSNG